jgi:hypothetical protein
MSNQNPEQMNEYLKNNHGVHIAHPEMDTTICGDAIEGDEPDLLPCKTVKAQAVTCRLCNIIIEHCRQVPNKSLASTVNQLRSERDALKKQLESLQALIHTNQGDDYFHAE